MASIARPPVSRIATGLLLVLVFSPFAYGQAKPEDFVKMIPRRFREHLAKRLDLYVEYQREQQWGKLASLLGDYYYPVGWRRTKYRPEQKRWMIELIRDKPMLSFLVKGGVMSSDQIGIPWKRTYYWIDGTAKYSEGENVLPLKGGVIAYFDNGIWFFTPLVDSEYGLRLVNPPTPASNKLMNRTRN